MRRIRSGGTARAPTYRRRRGGRGARRRRRGRRAASARGVHLPSVSPPRREVRETAPPARSRSRGAPVVEPLRRPGSTPERGSAVPPWRDAPTFPVRREHAVRAAGASGRDVARGNHRRPRNTSDQDPPFPAAPLSRLCARLREGAHVLAQVDGPARSRGNAEHLRDRAPAADDETAATRRERAPRSASASSRNATRFGAPKSASSSSSKTKTGTTCVPPPRPRRLGRDDR